LSYSTGQAGQGTAVSGCCCNHAGRQHCDCDLISSPITDLPAWAAWSIS